MKYLTDTSTLSWQHSLQSGVIWLECIGSWHKFIILVVKVNDRTTRIFETRITDKFNYQVLDIRRKNTNGKKNDALRSYLVGQQSLFVKTASENIAAVKAQPPCGKAFC